jgi:hypothetical protein
MQPTAYPDINNPLTFLLSQVQRVLGKKLVGLYLYGSLVTGDFDDEISNIDLLAATSGDIDEPEFDELQKMQDDTVQNYPKWEGRLEIAYLSQQALKTFRTHTSTMAVVSPGEPFHFNDAGRDWLMNWYMVREKGITLFGPPPEAIIELISRAEFVKAVKEHAVAWRRWIDDAHSRPFQAYAILTLCRALYTCKNGEQVSKIKAASWAEQELPEWSSLIRNAVLWRRAWREEDVDHSATMPETRRFANYVIDQILS